jgi:hypothetical protein
MGFIEVAVVIFVFSRLQGRLEMIIVSILGLIYLTIRTINFANGIAMAKLAVAFKERRLSILSHLGDVEHDKIISKKDEPKLDRIIYRSYIRQVFIVIILFIYLYELYTVLS